MSKKQDGGPAFPTESIAQGAMQSRIGGGMSLRDYFAAAALQGMLADTSLKGPIGEWTKRAYLLADAMIEERERND